MATYTTKNGKKSNTATKGPLSGVRVTDFTWFWAGPHATLLLAFMGAEVIKIESINRLDPMRATDLPQRSALRGDPRQVPIETWEQSVMWHDINLNKLGIRLNLRSPKAIELAKGLIKVSDVVIENFAPGVLERMGLGYQEVKRLKPDIIMLSSSACGQTGPQSHYVGMATIFSATSGAAHYTGYPDLLPTDLRDGSDLRVATASAFALTAALDYQRRTGQGQFIDLSSQECLTTLFGDQIMDYSMNQRAGSRNGNRDDIMAPHNCYPCRGEDRWVSIAVASDEEWKAFCKVAGHLEWTEDPRFADSFTRWHHQDELDQLVGQWTRDRTDYEVMQLMQKAGIASAPSMSSEAVFSDPHLRSWGAFGEVDHPVMGKREVVGPPWKFSKTPARVTRHAPLLGEHNEQVFGELLGLPKQEIARLITEGVID